ncbi:MAG: rhomboid family intramembrane serine protease [Crocinitomicaceae bacterium]|nr:rhomboid family intramembrane serine protease [Crocinitomicaceae bacterium]
MDFTVLTVIIAITSIISISAFKNQEKLYRFLFIPSHIQETKEYYRFFSHIFIHADFGHLIFNMLSLYFLGSFMLDAQGGTYIGGSGELIVIQDGWMQEYGYIIGQIMFGLLYFAGGLFATIIPYIRNKNNPNYCSLGASGAVSAVIFAAILWNPTMKLNIMFIPIGIPAYIFGPLYIAYEIYMDKRGGTGIAHDAHLGGAIFGVLFVLFTNIEVGKRFLELIF